MRLGIKGVEKRGNKKKKALMLYMHGNTKIKSIILCVNLNFFKENKTTFNGLSKYSFTDIQY